MKQLLRSAEEVEKRVEQLLPSTGEVEKHVEQLLRSAGAVETHVKQRFRTSGMPKHACNRMNLVDFTLNYYDNNSFQDSQ